MRDVAGDEREPSQERRGWRALLEEPADLLDELVLRVAWLVCVSVVALCLSGGLG